MLRGSLLLGCVLLVGLAGCSDKRHTVYGPVAPPPPPGGFKASFPLHQDEPAWSYEKLGRLRVE